MMSQLRELSVLSEWERWHTVSPLSVAVTLASGFLRVHVCGIRQTEVSSMCIMLPCDAARVAELCLASRHTGSMR